MSRARIPGGRRAVRALGAGVAIALLAVAAVPARAQWLTLRIETAPGGNAPAAGGTLAAGDSARVYAAAYDSGGSYLGPVAAQWEAVPGLATLSDDFDSTTLVGARTAGSFELRASAFAGTATAKAGFVVVPGPATRLAAFAQNPEASTPPIASLAVTTDSTVVLHAGSYDAFDNFTGSRSVTWSVDAPLATLVPNQASLSVLDPRRVGTTRLRGQAAGLAAFDLPLAIAAGRLASLRITVNGLAVPDTLLVAGQTMPLAAHGADADGNALPAPSATSWRIAGGGLVLASATGATNEARATSPGASRIRIAHGNIEASTGVVHVGSGPLARVRLSRASESWVPLGAATFDADAVLGVYALGQDAAGNWLGAVNATWTTTNTAVAAPLATTGSATTLTFARAGSARLVVAAAGAAADTSGVLTVVPGRLAHVRIETRADGSGLPLGARSLSCDSTLVVHAVGRDANLNFLGAHAVAWDLTGAIGAMSPPTGSSATLIPTRPGTTFVTAVDGVHVDLAGPLTIRAGAPYALGIVDDAGVPLAPRVLEPGDAHVAVAMAMDRDGNALSPVASAWTWIGDDLAPVPGAPLGRYEWTASRTGAGQLHAAAPDLVAATSAVLTVATGAPAWIEIQDTTGLMVGDRDLSADSPLELRARAFDSGGNLLGDVPVAWRTIAIDGAADVAPASGSATILRPRHPGGVRVACTHPSGVGAETGLLTIHPGRIARVRIETAADGSGTPIGVRALVAGDRLPLFAVARDAAGHFVAPITVTWFVDGGIGRLESSNGSASALLAERTGQGRVRVSAPLLDADTTDLITIAAGAPVALHIEHAAGDPLDPVGATLRADDALAVFAVARDAFGNIAAPPPAVWSIVGPPGAASLAPAGPTSSVTLQPHRISDVVLQATWNGRTAASGNIRIVAGAPALLRIESAPDGTGTAIGDRTLAAGAMLVLHAVARDAQSNFAGTVPALWGVLGAAGSLDTTWGEQAIFSALVPGASQVTAHAPGLGTAKTGTFAVTTGAPALLHIERTAGDPFDPIDAASLAAGDSLAAVAVVRDPLGNAVGSVVADWSLVGDAHATVLSRGTGTDVRLHARHPGSVRLRATWNNYEATSGPIQVQAGPPFGTILLGIAPETLRADGASRARLVVGPIADAWSNPVADDTRVDITIDRGQLSPGAQRPVSSGMVEVTIIAPTTPGPIHLDVTSGAATATVTLDVLPPASFDVRSFTPAVVLGGAPLDAAIEITSTDPLRLDIASGALRFDDGNGGSVEVPLAASRSLTAGATATLRFGPAPLGLRPGFYAPRLLLAGHDAVGHAFEWDMALGASTLELLAGGTLQIATRAPSRATRGAVVRFEVEVVNRGDADVALDAARTHVRGPGYGAALLAPAQVRRGETVRLAFAPTAWPETSALGPVSLDLELHGTQPGGDFAAVLAIVPIDVQAPAALSIAPGSLSPTVAPIGSTPVVRLVIHNAGGSAVGLDTGTTLQVGDRSVALTAAQLVPPDSNAMLEFAPVSLAGFAPGRVPLVVAARGAQNGNPFETILPGPDSLTVFAPSAVTILAVQPSQPAVTRGQTESWSLHVVVQNAGTSAARIDAADVRVVLGGLDRTASYGLQREPLGGTLAPGAVDTLDFQVTRTGDDIGLATLEGSLRGVDLVSGKDIEADTFAGGKGSLRVQAPAAPRLGLGSFAPAAAVAGQSGTIVATLTIVNDGEAAIDVDLTSLGIETMPSVPVDVTVAAGTPHLNAGAALELRVALGPFAAVPPGEIAFAIAPRCVESNRALVVAVRAQARLPVLAPAAVTVTALQAPAAVLRAAQRPWTARVTVANHGGSAARLVSPRLEFAADGPPAGFGVVPPATFEDGSALVLAAGASGTLRFEVAPTDVVARTLQIGFAANATEMPTGRAFAVAGGATALLHVQLEPLVGLVDSTLAPQRASRGQLVAPALVVRQDGEATFELDATRSWARVRGGSARHALVAPLELPGGTAAQLVFAAAALDAPLGDAPLDVHLEGTTLGEPFSADVATAIRLRIDPQSSLAITSVRAATPRVTRGQSRAWSVRVAVENHGGDAVLDAASLGLALGAESISDEFALHAPAAFESGTTLLVAGGVDTLQFDVETTADRAGVVTLDATVRAHDRNSGATLVVTSFGVARGTVRLVDPARPVLVEAVPSQTRLSAGQRAAWRVRAVVRNDGGSPWRPDWAAATLAIGTALDDEVVAPAPAAAPALEPGATASADFEVRATGAELGTLAVLAALAGTQETDGRRIDAAPHPAVAVRSQTPGRARIDPLVVHTVRDGFANAGQSIRVDIAVANDGESDLAPTRLRLRAAGATPADTVCTLALAGGTGNVVQMPLRLRADAGPVVLDVEGLDAADVNDSSRTDAWSAPRHQQAALVAEAPGILQVDVQPSQARVSSRQSREWTLAVAVANRGEETLHLRAPQAADVEFRRAGTPQLDYLVVAPRELEQGGLALAGGSFGILHYRVVRTGDAGGTVDIAVALAATHANEPAATAATAIGAATIEVDAEPGVRIVSTESLTWRRERGYDDFHVDIGQSFRIRVVVENTGGSALDSVAVGVESQRGNSRVDGPRVLASLVPGERGELFLPAVAGTWLSQAGLPESFTARIVAAQDRNTGLSVLPQASLDNSTFAYIERPAVLGLEAWIESPDGARDGILSVGQTCVVAARVRNHGDASFLATGRLGLQLPAEFGLEAGTSETFFAPDAVLRWTLRALAAAPAASLELRIVAVPADANDGAPARLERDAVLLPFEVRATGALAATFVATPSRAARVSAGQIVRVEVVVSGDADLVGRRAALEVPAGWTLQAGSPAEIALADGAESHAAWTLRVGPPANAARLGLHVTASDRNDDSPRAYDDSLVLTVQRPARLALTAAIVAPQEAMDGRLVPGQTFTLRARIRNDGEADVGAAAATLRLVAMPAGFSAPAAAVDVVLAGREAVVDFDVVAPPTPRSTPVTLGIGFERLPPDANSGADVELDPDATVARVDVVVGADAVVLDATSTPGALVAAGQRSVELGAVQVTNNSAHAVRIEALGVEPQVDGVAAPGAFVRFELADETGARTAVAVGSEPQTWVALAATLGPGATARWTLRADIAPSAPAGTLGAVFAAADGAPYLHAVQASSGAAVPVQSGDVAAPALVRVVGAALVAHNAPNPFRVGRETTSIRYQMDAAGDVLVRVFTLQGELVWETRRHDAAVGPALNAIVWDGRNGAGHAVRNGVYVCQVDAAGRSTRFKIAVVR